LRKTRPDTGHSGEKSLIEAIRARPQPKNRAVQLGIGDDCALLRPRKGEDVAVTTDFSLEKIHFLRELHPPEAVGHRCLARGLSDLAAMGAQPLAAFLSLAVPRELTLAGRSGRSWMERFLDGLMALAKEWEVPLAGGDMAQSPTLESARRGPTPTGDQASGLVAADIVLLGGVEKRRALRRSGARPGDLLYVTGALGGAAAELLALRRNPKAFQKLVTAADRHPHLYPQPRIGVGRQLMAARLATAAIDISDGLSTDLHHLCEESDLAAELDTAAIPIHSLARQSGFAGGIEFAPGKALELALHGGEDYELLFTCPPGKKIPSTLAGVPIHRIGQTKPKRRGQPLVVRLESTGKRVRRIPVEPAGWAHFA
jgi:thiamine-monophosphate kinase